jgi:glyceraldehyde 3-phosphate dehydrogenase
VDGQEIKIYAEKDAKNAPWGKLDVDVVLECTGFYTSKAKSQAHLDAGAKKVVISAPAGTDLKTIVFSVNENILTQEDKIISTASCTTNCLAPMAKALNDAYPIVSGIMCTVHALHRRPDDPGRPAPQRRPTPCPRRRRHTVPNSTAPPRPSAGDPGAQRQADRLRSAWPCPPVHPRSCSPWSRARTLQPPASTP